MTRSDSDHVLGLFAKMPAQRLPVVIDHLTRSGDLLGRAMAHGRRYQFDHDPRTLTAALDDFDAGGGTVADRSEAARFLALRVVEAGLVGQPFDAVRQRRMLAATQDDPAHPGTLAGLKAMTSAIAAINSDPSTDMATALAEIDALDPPPDSSYAAVLPAVRSALRVRIGADQHEMSFVDDAVAMARQMRHDPRFGAAQQPVVRLMGIAGQAMDALQRGDHAGAVAAASQMRDTLAGLPVGDPTVDALRGRLETLLGPLAR